MPQGRSNKVASPSLLEKPKVVGAAYGNDRRPLNCNLVLVKTKGNGADKWLTPSDLRS